MKLHRKLLEETRTTLNHAEQVPQIATTLGVYGYDGHRRQEGAARYENARAAQDAFEEALMEKKNGANLVVQQRTQTKQHLQSDMGVTRLVSKEQGVEIAWLANIAPQDQSATTLYFSTIRFYETLQRDPLLHAMMEARGINSARIELGFQKAHALQTAQVEQQLREENVRQLRRQRNEAFQALKDWMKTFRQVARAAFSATPTYLVILGIVSATPTRSKRTPQPEQPPVEPPVSEPSASAAQEK